MYQLQFANVDSVSKTLKRVRFYTLSINQNIDDADHSNEYPYDQAQLNTLKNIGYGIVRCRKGLISCQKDEQTAREISASERTVDGRAGTQSVTIRKLAKPSSKMFSVRHRQKSRKS